LSQRIAATEIIVILVKKSELQMAAQPFADDREGILKIPSCGHLLAASPRRALASAGKIFTAGRITGNDAG
jgi:hypothetical protein